MFAKIQWLEPGRWKGVIDTVTKDMIIVPKGKKLEDLQRNEEIKIRWKSSRVKGLFLEYTGKCYLTDLLVFGAYALSDIHLSEISLTLICIQLISGLVSLN